MDEREKPRYVSTSYGVNPPFGPTTSGGDISAAALGAPSGDVERADYSELLERLDRQQQLQNANTPFGIGPSRIYAEAAAAIRALLSDRQAGTCELCAGACRGHSMGNPSEWEPEPGSRMHLLQTARQAGINEGLEMAAKVAEERRAIYAKKWADADPFGPEVFNRHEYMQHTMEAFDHLLEEIAAVRAMKVEK